MTNLSKIALLSGIALVGLASPSYAADAAPDAPAAATDTSAAEIVVTAQKRTEKLVNVPISVTVVSADQLSAQKIYSVADLARTSPALEMIQAFGGPGGGGQIRGIGTQSFTRSAEGAVGIVVDGVPQGNVQNNAIFDLQRVEVLKGPQGTLFGLTSSAGVINMTTVAPDASKVSGYVHVDVSPIGDLGSEFNQWTVRGAVNVPTSATSALRLAVNYNRLNGVQRNAFTNKNSVQDDIAVRARFKAELGDKVTLNLIADYDDRRQNYGDPQFTYVSVPAGTPLANELAACGIVASPDNNARCSNIDNHVRTRNYGFSGQFDVSLGAGTLTSITGYRKNEQLPSTVDIMATPTEFTQIFYRDQINSGEQFSQELRYSSPSNVPLEYTLGGFYSRYTGTAGYAPGGAFNVGTYQIAPFFVNFVKDGSSTRTTNESFAAFGQATYHVSEQFAVLAGLRFTHQNLSDAQSVNPFSAASVATSATLSQSNLSGKIGIQYIISPSVHTYATYTRGYKGPQVVPAALGGTAQVIKAEIPDAFEVGAKGSFLGGKLGYDINAFLTKVSNYQGQRCTINAVGVLSCQGESIPSVTSKGFEITLFGKPTRNLNMNVGFVYNDAKLPNGWTGFNPSDLRTPVAGTNIGITSLSNAQLIGSPKAKFVINGDYTVPLGGTAQGINLVIGGDAVHKSSIRLGYSGDAAFVYAAHWTVSLRAGIHDADGKWSIEAFVRNLTQNREPATIFGGPAFVPPATVPFIPNGTVSGISGWATTASRRQVGFSAEVKF